MSTDMAESLALQSSLEITIESVELAACILLLPVLLVLLLLTGVGLELMLRLLRRSDMLRMMLRKRRRGLKLNGRHAVLVGATMSTCSVDEQAESMQLTQLTSLVSRDKT